MLALGLGASGVTPTATTGPEAEPIANALDPAPSTAPVYQRLDEGFRLGGEQHWTPWIGKSQGADHRFYSWLEEDRDMLQRYPHWAKKTNGTYLEMGAYDGYNLSNSMFFYETLGWKGVLIEPQPSCQQKMQARRPGDLGYRSPLRNTIFANASCAHFETLSLAATGTCDAGVGGSDFVSSEWKQNNGKRVKNVEVGCSPVGHMLRTAGIGSLDFWSLDVVGAELEALQGMDWSIPVHTILIEMLPGNNRKGEAGLAEIRGFLLGRGFVRHGRVIGTMGYDELWENPRFPEVSVAGLL
jgi:hypothetical protein